MAPALLIGAAAPAFAQDDPLAPLPTGEAPAAQPAAPTITPTPAPPPAARPVVVPKDWRGVFDAIRAGDWASARAGIAALPDHVLKPVARAELLTARN
ncbi:MAG TPA: hypothetical protein VEH84_11920, partial [Alphaproteobacteria bacterium]|nr:hypothetical protein [Alphaproteobacteria bacterium]